MKLLTLALGLALLLPLSATAAEEATKEAKPAKAAKPAAPAPVAKETPAPTPAKKRMVRDTSGILVPARD